MANRTYAQINCSLKDSAKIRALKTPKACWAYLVSHLADQSNFLGMFRYPKFMWAHDSNVGEDEIDDLIADLVRVGLVEYDHKDEVVRIVGWFHKKNCPDNGSQTVKAISDYQRLEIQNRQMLQRSIAEFAVGITKRGRNWPKEWGNTRKKIEELLRQTLKDTDSNFLEAIIEEAEKTSRSVIDELDSMLPAIKQHRKDRVSTRCSDTRQDETILKQNENKTETCAVEIENQPNVPDLDEVDDMRRRKKLESSAMPRKETRDSALAKGL